MRRAKNIGNIIVITLLVSMILRFCFVLINIEHNCTHNDCAICSIINKYKEDLKGFNPSLYKVIYAIKVIFPPVVFYLYKRLFNKQNETLIGLKVQLNN